MQFSEDRVRFVCDWLSKNHPDKDCDFYKMWISTEILRVLVGNEWVNQAVFPNNHSVTSPEVQETIRFLRSRESGFQFQERVSRFANRLYDIQEVPGLERVVKSLIEGDIALSYAEIEASSFFFRRGIEHEFITPTGNKGRDFDICLTKDGVNCEVKHKIEETDPSRKTLETTLSRAKAQVPEAEPAIFFIKIPIEWVRYSGIKEIIERTKGNFFPRSNNVLGFILYWEEPVQEREGAFFWKFRYEVNLTCEFKNDELAKSIINKEVERNDSIVSLMNKYIKKCDGYPNI